MKTIKFDFKIITPLIISGANRNDVELREQSLKGILRWWFRFYKGASLSLEELKNIEGKIWGSQEMASRVKIFIERKKLQTDYAYLRMNDVTNPDIKRKSFNQRQSFEVNFKLLHPLPQNCENEINRTLFFLSNFGGLGARWRRGFGSLIIGKYENKNFKNLDDILQYIKLEVKKSQISQNKNNNFIHLGNTSIYLIKPKNNFWSSWDECMNNLRDNFYRVLKGNLETGKIAIGDPRSVSPLIIQIKKCNLGYYGVILVWKVWNKYDDFMSFGSSLSNFEIRRFGHELN